MLGGGSGMRGRPFGGAGQPGMGASVTEDMMHTENDESISRLGDRVRGLKEVAAPPPNHAHAAPHPFAP